MMRLAATIACMLLVPTLSLAHAQLRRAEPPVGGTVQSPPTQVSLFFSEAVEPRFSMVTVAGASGTAVDRHDVHTAPDDPQCLIVGLDPVPPGVYQVIWHVVSVDTHKTEGSFSFTVAP